MERLPGRCSRCGGTFWIEDGTNKCVACSRKTEGIAGMAAYYNYNKEAILADIKLLGRPKARVKWKIPAGTLTGLQRRWSKNGSTPPAPAAESTPRDDDEILFSINKTDLQLLTPAEQDKLYEVVGMICISRVKRRVKGGSL